MHHRQTGQRSSPDANLVAHTGWRRRDVLVGAAPGGLVLGSGALATPMRAVSGLVVADARFAASRAFADEAGRKGQRVAWIAGDVTDIYNDLDLLWRREKIAVAGFTAYGAFFCLERLAMDRGLRVTARREHRDETLLISWTIALRRPGDNA